MSRQNERADLQLASAGTGRGKFSTRPEPDGAAVPRYLNGHRRTRCSDLARDRVLADFGWQLVRIPAWRCLREANAVAAEIAERAADFAGDRHNERGKLEASFRAG